MTDSAGVSPRPAPGGPRAGAIAGLAVVALALAFVVVFARPTPLSERERVAEIAALHGEDAESGAPGIASPTLLVRELDGVPFPNLAPLASWRAQGVREDTVRGRPAVTVFYVRQGRRLGYTIVGGPPLGRPVGARRAAREGTLLLSFEAEGRTVVSFERRGHTCVLSSLDVPLRALYDLAGWRGEGTIPF